MGGIALPRIESVASAMITAARLISFKDTWTMALKRVEERRRMEMLR